MAKNHGNLPRQLRTETSSQFTFEELLLHFFFKKKGIQKKTRLSIESQTQKLKWLQLPRTQKWTEADVNQRKGPFGLSALSSCILRALQPEGLKLMLEAKASVCLGPTGYCMLTHLVQAVGCWGPGLGWGPPSLRPTFWICSKASRLFRKTTNDKLLQKMSSKLH